MERWYDSGLKEQRFPNYKTVLEHVWTVGTRLRIDLKPIQFVLLVNWGFYGIKMYFKRQILIFLTINY